MTDRGRVTITLGRGSQVVKRSDHALDITHRESMPLSGSKRSVRDRLGSSGGQIDNKRQRGTDDESYRTDAYIGRDDLRLKLMQKNSSRRLHGDDNGREMDLREKLSRKLKPPHSQFDARHPMHEAKEVNILWQNSSTRSTEDLSRMDTSRSYSGWTADRIRRRSPDEMLGSSRGLSPPLRNIDELQRRPLSRSYDASRVVPYMGNNVPPVPRPRLMTAVSPFMAKPTLAPGSGKPMAPLLGQLPSPSGISQKNLYGVDEQHTVDGLLSALGLGKYAVNFKAEEVDMTALKQMGEHDLKEMGIPMGPRKKILLALAPRARRQQGQL